MREMKMIQLRFNTLCLLFSSFPMIALKYKWHVVGRKIPLEWDILKQTGDNENCFEINREKI
jgi:hypothetical protein